MRSFLIALVGLSLFTACSSTADLALPQPSAVELRGNEALQHGRLEEAEELFATAFRSGAPTFLSAIGLARTGLAQGRWDRFDAAITDAVPLAPRTPGAHDLLGRTFLQASLASDGGRRQQRAALAASYFTSAAKQTKAKIPALSFHLGMTHIAMSRPVHGIPFLLDALQEEPPTLAAVAPLHDAMLQVGRERELLDVLDVLEARGVLPVAMQDARTKLSARLGPRPTATKPSER